MPVAEGGVCELLKGGGCLLELSGMGWVPVLRQSRAPRVDHNETCPNVSQNSTIVVVVECSVVRARVEGSVETKTVTIYDLDRLLTPRKIMAWGFVLEVFERMR
jgi:hypothetical protein